MNSLYVPHLDDTIYLGEEITLHYIDDTPTRHFKINQFSPCNREYLMCDKYTTCPTRCAVDTGEGGGKPCIAGFVARIEHHGNKINKITEL